MKVDELIALARVRSEDTVEPYLQSDENYIADFDEAQQQAAMRASLLYDDTSAFLTITLVKDQESYELDPRIWRIDKDGVRFQAAGQSRTHCVALTGYDQLKQRPGLYPTTGARPERAAMRGRRLYLWPTPNKDGDTIQLRVYRLALQALANLADEPEIEPHLHKDLVPWALYRAYGRPDSDLFDASLAQMWLREFELRFGALDSENVHRRHNERRKATTRYGGD